MKFEFLADRPDAINLVAQWYYDEWAYDNPQASPASIAQKLSSGLNRDRVPLLLLATDSYKVVAAVELKYREMDIYPDRVHWLGGLYVTPDYRGHGLGVQLVAHALKLAEEFGISKLYLQTEKLDGGIYTGLGWRPLERVNNKGINVLVMEIDIGR